MNVQQFAAQHLSVLLDQVILNEIHFAFHELRHSMTKKRMNVAGRIMNVVDKNRTASVLDLPHFDSFSIGLFKLQRLWLKRYFHRLYSQRSRVDSIFLISTLQKLYLNKIRTGFLSLREHTVCERMALLYRRALRETPILSNAINFFHTKQKRQILRIQFEGWRSMIRSKTNGRLRIIFSLHRMQQKEVRQTMESWKKFNFSSIVAQRYTESIPVEQRQLRMNLPLEASNALLAGRSDLLNRDLSIAPTAGDSVIPLTVEASIRHTSALHADGELKKLLEARTLVEEFIALSRLSLAVLAQRGALGSENVTSGGVLRDGSAMIHFAQTKNRKEMLSQMSQSESVDNGINRHQIQNGLNVNANQNSNNSSFATAMLQASSWVPDLIPMGHLTSLSVDHNTAPDILPRLLCMRDGDVNKSFCELPETIMSEMKRSLRLDNTQKSVSLNSANIGSTSASVLSKMWRWTLLKKLIEKKMEAERRLSIKSWHQITFGNSPDVVRTVIQQHSNLSGVRDMGVKNLIRCLTEYLLNRRVMDGYEVLCKRRKDFKQIEKGCTAISRWKKKYIDTANCKLGFNELMKNMKKKINKDGKYGIDNVSRFLQVVDKLTTRQIILHKHFSFRSVRDGLIAQWARRDLAWGLGGLEILEAKRVAQEFKTKTLEEMTTTALQPNDTQRGVDGKSAAAGVISSWRHAWLDAQLTSRDGLHAMSSVCRGDWLEKVNDADGKRSEKLFAVRNDGMLVWFDAVPSNSFKHFNPIAYAAVTMSGRSTKNNKLRRDSRDSSSSITAMDMDQLDLSLLTAEIKKEVTLTAHDVRARSSRSITQILEFKKKKKSREFDLATCLGVVLCDDKIGAVDKRGSTPKSGSSSFFKSNTSKTTTLDSTLFSRRSQSILLVSAARTLHITCSSPAQTIDWLHGLQLLVRLFRRSTALIHADREDYFNSYLNQNNFKKNKNADNSSPSRSIVQTRKKLGLPQRRKGFKTLEDLYDEEVVGSFCALPLSCSSLGRLRLFQLGIRLRARAEQSGISVGDLVRRAVERVILMQEEQKERKRLLLSLARKGGGHNKMIVDVRQSVNKENEKSTVKSLGVGDIGDETTTQQNQLHNGKFSHVNKKGAQSIDTEKQVDEDNDADYYYSGNYLQRSQSNQKHYSENYSNNKTLNKNQNIKKGGGTSDIHTRGGTSVAAGGRIRTRQ